MREPCYNCCIKHLGRACVFACETALAYPEYALYIIGELSHAEDEIVGLHPEVAMDIRDVRLKYQDDFSYNVNQECERIFMKVLELRALADAAAPEEALP